jgi:hypothetical protein
MEDTSIPTLLTPDQIKTVHNVWKRVPMVGLPHHGFGKAPDTFEDLVSMMRTMSETIGRLIHERDEVIKQARDMEREIEMGGKLLRRMLGTDQERSAREALKAVQTKLVGATGFNAASVQQLAHDYGVEL